MRNARLRTDLAALRAALISGAIGLDEAYGEFERMTYQLDGVTPGDARALRALVNDLELVRFGQRPENRLDAADAVLRRAQAIFHA